MQLKIKFGYHANIVPEIRKQKKILLL